MELLLHSLAEMRELIFQVIDAASPRALVEIGAESGVFTEQLVSWVKSHGGTLTTIDPAPAARVRALAEEHPGVHHLLLEKSPQALAHAPPGDLYLIDGDHNYSVVIRELRALDERAIVFLHDVGWPCARRDFYYQPSDLPSDELHPHVFEDGVRLDDPGVVRSGFRGEGVFAIARVEGGEKNGVLSAIEAFLVEKPHYDLWIVPAVFGLGVLVPHAHPAREAVAAILRVYHQNPLISRLEENRLRNYLTVIALQDALADRDREHARALTAEQDKAQLQAGEQARRIEEREQKIAALEQKIAALEGKPLVRMSAMIDRALKRPAP